MIDVQFADFMRDPFATIRALYAALGRDLSPSPSRTCGSSSPPTPGTAGATGTAWADTGLDAAQVREQVRGYQRRFGVPDEPIR